MDNRPQALTSEEMTEIAAFGPIREMWGEESAEEMRDILENIYCVKFNFMSGSPGYHGDLIIIQGDALSDALPVSLTRDRDGKLRLVEYYGS